MRTILVNSSPSLYGLLPSKLPDIYVPTKQPLPDAGEQVRLVDDVTGDVLTELAVVADVDAQSHTYSVRVW